MLAFEVTDYGKRLGVTFDHLGFIPLFFSEFYETPAREQLDQNYQHGGGWRPLQGWTAAEDGTIKYPGDERLRPIAEARLREERILIYPHSWVQIRQKDGSFEIGRVD